MNNDNDTTRHLTEPKEHASGRSKNVCTSAVLAAFGIDPTNYHYAQYSDDVKRVLRRSGYAVRSRKSSLPKSVRTIAQLRRWLASVKDTDKDPAPRALGYYVGVSGHAIALGPDGRVAADTDPRKSDRRRIVHISAVWPK